MNQLASSTRALRIALLVPSSNTVMENDLHAMLDKEHYRIHTDRMYLVETTREQELEMISRHAPRAVDDLATARPDLLVFGCTSAGSLEGLDYDATVCADLGKRAGCPCLGVISAVSLALEQAGISRLAVITPYNEDLTRAVAGAATKEGREVVAAYGLGITDNFALAEPGPEDIVRFARDRLANINFDGLFVSCTNFRALEAKKSLEAAFGVPVVTSNSATVDAIRKFSEGVLVL